VESKIRVFLQKYRIEFIIAALVALVFTAHSRIGIFVDKARPVDYGVTMAVLSLAVFLVARISYPKIYKFKILLSGYVVVAFIINFFMISTETSVKIFGLNFFQKSMSIMPSGNFAYRFLFTILNLNLLVIMLVNAYVNYNAGKHSSWVAFALNIIVYFTVLIILPAHKSSHFVKGFLQTHLLINLVITGLIILLSFFNIEEEHNYGSIIVAVSFIVFYCEIYSQNLGQVKFLLPAMEVIIIWGMFAHWVNCLHHRAHYDPLLKIYNRQYMDNIIRGIADIRFGENLSVMMCDIDHFKKVNDTYGHAAGDAILFHIAQIIRETSLPEGIVCRYGGEEIIVFLRDKIGNDAKAKAEKIRKAVKAAGTKFKSKNIKVTLSIGVASTKEGMQDVGRIIKKADDCVYKAKKSGRDKVVAD
jgi:diguanylate cyclase (GGDEF)-like protein